MSVSGMLHKSFRDIWVLTFEAAKIEQTFLWSFRNYLLFQLIPSETCVTLEHECTRIK
jgi:hypothetical protein